jgi:hypothetical protein
MVLDESIQGMPKHRCYRAVRHFFTDNVLAVNDHFDELFQLLDAARANLTSKRVRNPCERPLREMDLWRDHE